MKENLSHRQTFIDNAPDAMHNAFESDEEMLKFYLTMNRFVNPITYNREKTTLERLNDLHKTLATFADFTGPVGTHSYDGMDNMVKGSGAYMMRTEISINNRHKNNSVFASHLQFLFHLASNKAYAKKLSGIYCSHICKINYLIRKIEAESAAGLTDPTEKEPTNESGIGNVKAGLEEMKEGTCSGRNDVRE